MEELLAAGIGATQIWPGSTVAGQESVNGDMHTLYPARLDVSAARGGRRFADIPDDETDTWYRLGETLSSTPVDHLDEYSELADERFEPRESVKGDIARAMFYYYAMYQPDADPSFFLSQVDDLVAWAEADPVSIDEALRALAIRHVQGTINPFVLDPGLHLRMYRRSEAETGYLRNDSQISHQSGITLNELSARSVTDYNADGRLDSQNDRDEFIEIVNSSTSAIDINGWMLGDDSETVTISGLSPVGPTSSVVVFTGGADISNFDPGPGNQVTSVSGLDLNDIFDGVGLKNLDGAYIAVHWGPPAGSQLNAAFLNGAVPAGDNVEFTAPWKIGESKTRLPDFTGMWFPHPEIKGVRDWSKDVFVWLNNPMASPGRAYNGIVLDFAEEELPGGTYLAQNYPNPFNSRTSFRYTLERTGWVDLRVYNVLGELVEVLDEGLKPAGEYETSFDASGLSSGIYLYTLTADSYRKTRKMVLIK